MCTNSVSIDKANAYLQTIIKEQAEGVEIDTEIACFLACYFKLKYHDPIIKAVEEDINSQIHLNEKYPYSLSNLESAGDILSVFYFCDEYEVNKYNTVLLEGIHNLAISAMEDEIWNSLDLLSIYVLKKTENHPNIIPLINAWKTKLLISQNKDDSWGYWEWKIDATSLSSIFLLLFGNKEEQILAEKGVSWLLKKQSLNGSWNDYEKIPQKKDETLKHYKANLFEQDYYQKYSTIFSICAIRLSENKHKDEILHDAYEWINLQQKENGAWQVYNRNKIHFTLSIVSVFSESIVRLISEKEPLKPISVNNSSINLPQGAKWEEVTIKFLNGTDVKILHNGQLIKETSGLEIGFRPKKGEKDNVGWELLKLLSKQEDNQSSWGDRNAGNALRSQKKSTVRILKKYFKLNSDPFFPYKKIKGYKSRFNLIPESSGNNIYIPPNFDDYKIPDDIARADL